LQNLGMDRKIDQSIKKIEGEDKKKKYFCKFCKKISLPDLLLHSIPLLI
jgi:hypothetical protein